MFADTAKIFIKSGNGGNGHVSFRRELYVPNGGPDGRDPGARQPGPPGGSVINKDARGVPDDPEAPGGFLSAEAGYFSFSPSRKALPTFPPSTR